MSKNYNGEEKRTQANTALRILINVQEQTHDCVKSLTKDVSRNSALTVSNGVKLDAAIEYNKKCDERLTEVELWKAGHVGEAVGKSKLFDKLSVKITVLGTMGALIIGACAFYYTSVKPTLNKSVGFIEKISVIEKIYQELVKH